MILSYTFFVLLVVVVVTTMTPAAALPMPAPENADLTQPPYRYHPGFIPTELRAEISDYITAWDRAQRGDMNGRVNSVIEDMEMASRMWNLLIGSNETRRDMLRMPTRPGWRPVAFSHSIIPCVYRKSGAEVHIHRGNPHHHDPKTLAYMDATFETTVPGHRVNWSKFLLYPVEFQGGDLVFYSRDPNYKPRRQKSDPRPVFKETHRIKASAGSGILFDLWYPHAGEKITSPRKELLGLRVMYEYEAAAAAAAAEPKDLQTQDIV